jgi:hypothetical protein
MEINGNKWKYIEVNCNLFQSYFSYFQFWFWLVQIIL